MRLTNRCTGPKINCYFCTPCSLAALSPPRLSKTAVNFGPVISALDDFRFVWVFCSIGVSAKPNIQHCGSVRRKQFQVVAAIIVLDLANSCRRSLYKYFVGSLVKSHIGSSVIPFKSAFLFGITFAGYLPYSIDTKIMAPAL